MIQIFIVPNITTHLSIESHLCGNFVNRFIIPSTSTSIGIHRSKSCPILLRNYILARHNVNNIHLIIAVVTDNITKIIKIVVDT